jgi:triosephosphate isomerase
MSKYIFANWKMNVGDKESIALAENAVILARRHPQLSFAVFPAFTAIADVCRAAAETPLLVGGQDIFWEKNGAYTGEVSAENLKEIGCAYVLVGHSERRHLFGETDDDVNRKALSALAAGLVPIICVGETDDERRHGKMAAVVMKQTRAALAGVKISGTQKIIFAYEPVWAIGTGQACRPDEAAAAHALIRNEIVEVFGAARDLAHFSVIYGGSVDAKNIALYLEKAEIDGALVGGASQKAATFSALVAAADKI